MNSTFDESLPSPSESVMFICLTQKIYEMRWPLQFKNFMDRDRLEDIGGVRVWIGLIWLVIRANERLL
jgi:hypothetical protein